MSLDRIFRTTDSHGWKEDLAVIGRLSRPHALRLFAAAVCSLILSGINGAIAWSVKPALDTIFIRKEAEYLYLLPLGVIALFTLRGIFTFCNNYLMASIGAKIVRFLRQKVYEKLLSLPMSFHSRSSSGDVVSKILNDIGMVQSTVAFSIKDFLVESGTVLVLAGVAISRNVELALISFLAIPVIVFSIGKLGSRMKKTSMNTRLLLAQIATMLSESLQGMKIIKAFTMETALRKKNDKILSDHYRNSMREVRINEFSSFNADIVAGIGVAVIIFYGGSLVLSDRISSGDFFSFVAAVLLMFTPLKRLSRVHNSFQQGRTVLDRIRGIIAEPPEKSGAEAIVVQGGIVFENVFFRYPATQVDALEAISFSVRRGEIIALVGYSGAGKSTVVDLVAGFWHPTGGALYIDGKDIRTLSLQSLRNCIGAVTQDVILFDDTIRANILYGRPDATENEIIAAAKAAFAHEFIMELPERYETRIGERGVRLSGGQKQRITIARAILRNPSILILDEATSSLDTESEHQVQNALEVLMQGRTTIVIAHRLSTIQKANRIIVMSQGRIVQQGSHAELLAQGGLYAELYAMQFRTDDAEPDYTRQ
ncbi:MAG: ATP-binding cassette subfamily B bacterial MsbA [Nitrospirae bacterium]|nr:MAG: ATP-binding cassette subfamily B bacterial MsbA [Nitrospirota bacterium]